jgi:asparagine synthetase B (glutamine-hydrolysing)
MKQEEIERLRYRRQYLLTPEEIACPYIHITRKIGGNYNLYTHPDLIVSEFSNDTLSLILLGDIFDFEYPEKNNPEILNDLLSADFNDLIDRIDKYCGRFVLIYLNQGKMMLIHDATATRKVYYCLHNSKLWFSSQPHLLARVLSLEKSRDEYKQAFYNSKDFIRLFNSSIGNTTYYDEIFQLLPNHYLNVTENRIIRYWPRTPIQYKPVSEIAPLCAKIVQGTLRSITNRYEVTLPLTAGKDSRLLLAASRNIQDKVFYYINREPRLNEKSPDIQVPQLLASRFGFKFTVIEPPEVIDKDFLRVYYENNALASDTFLPFIYNYFRDFSDKVNLPGNTASAGFEVLKLPEAKITPKFIAEFYRVNKYAHAYNYYAEWLHSSEKTFRENNVNLVNMFYWEERLANWGTQIQLEKDIAQEDINPYNSRRYISLVLSVHPRYIEPPAFVLHRKIIRILWPEVLEVPINPGMMTTLKSLLHSLGLLRIYYKRKYRNMG